MKKLLVLISGFILAMSPIYAFAAGNDTSEVKFFLYNIADVKGQNLSEIITKSRSDAGSSGRQPSEYASPEMFLKPVAPSIGEKLIAISDSGVFTDTVKSLKFYSFDSGGTDYLMFYTKKYPERVMEKIDEGKVIFALKKDIDAKSSKRPVIIETIRASEKEGKEAFEKAAAYISDKANEEKVFSIKYGFDDESELSENISKKYKMKCFRINRRSERSDILIACLEARSTDGNFDNFMFVFDHGKIAFADYADYKFSFNFNGRDYFMTKQWLPESGCIGLVLYSIENGVLKTAASDYSFAD